MSKISLPHKVRVYFEPRDLWVGVYWNYEKDKYLVPASKLDIYICIIPMFPIRLSWGWGFLNKKFDRCNFKVEVRHSQK